MNDVAVPPATGESVGWRLELFNSWHLVGAGVPVALPGREQRLLALLALDGPHPRTYLAGTLWPDSSEHRASANLRECLSRIHRGSPGVVLSTGNAVALSGSVGIDVTEFHATAVALDQGIAPIEPRTALDTLRRADLLPGWYDDWVLFERERIEQLRIRGLETLADMLVGVDNGLALAASLVAIRLDPLRERAHRALLRVHVADGNPTAALHHYKTYAAQLHRDLQMAPTAAVREIVQPLLDGAPVPQQRDASKQRTHAPRDDPVDPANVSAAAWTNFPGAAQAVVDYLHARCPIELWLVTRPVDDRQYVLAARGAWSAVWPPGSSIPLSDSSYARVIGNGTTAFVGRIQHRRPADPREPLRSVNVSLGIPIHQGRKVYGSLGGLTCDVDPAALASTYPEAVLLARLLSTIVTAGAARHGEHPLEGAAVE
jgi:DNA-binding SARP family transcriptional activator